MQADRHPGDASTSSGRRRLVLRPVLGPAKELRRLPSQERRPLAMLPQLGARNSPRYPKCPASRVNASCAGPV